MMSNLISVPLAERRIIGYGASLAALTTLQTSGLNFEFFVDNTPALEGKSLGGLPIFPPDRLTELLAREDRDNFFIVVCVYENRGVATVFEQLTSLGLVHGRHFTDASAFHYGTMSAPLLEAVGIAPDRALFDMVRTLSLYSSLSNLTSIAGSWLIQELVRHQLAKVEGDVAEAGVYKGGNAYLTLSLLSGQLRGRQYHLLDSFQGFPEVCAPDPGRLPGQFSDVSLATLRNLFSHFESARLHVGFFDQTLPKLSDCQFSFVYADCDLYEPTFECCEFFYPRMPNGGMLLFHDYWHPVPGLPEGGREPYTGVARAVDEFAAKTGQVVVEFPETTHALIVKGAPNPRPTAS
jgi:hypothetical protein